MSISLKNNNNELEPGKFFDRFALIPESGMVVDREINKVVSIRALRLLYPQMTRQWLNSEGKETARRGELDSYELYTNANIAFKAAAGNVTPILELASILCGGNMQIFHWLLCWLAYPMQNVGAKMKTAPVFYGQQDRGKQLFVNELLIKVYPSHVTEVLSIDTIHTPMNWASGKLLLVSSDFDSIKTGSRKAKDLEFLIKHHSIRTTHKHGYHIWEKNHANLIILSSKSNPPEFALIKGGKERSIYYSLIRQNMLVPETLTKECEDYFSKPESRAAFADYLLNYDCGDFDEHSRLEDETLRCNSEAYRNVPIAIWQ